MTLHHLSTPLFGWSTFDDIDSNLSFVINKIKILRMSSRQLNVSWGLVCVLCPSGVRLDYNQN